MSAFRTSLQPLVAFDPVTQTILAANPRAQVVFGYPVDDLIGKPAALLCRSLAEGPDGTLPALLRSGRGQEVTVQRADGSRVTLEVTITEADQPQGAFQIAWFRELSAPLAGSDLDQLKRSEAQFRAAVEALGEGLIITDARDHVLYANTRLAQLLGLRAEEMVGRPVSEVLCPAEDPESGPAPRLHVTGMTDQQEARLVAAGGRHFWAEITVATLREGLQETVGGVAVVMDVTERKRVQEDLVAAIDAAEDANRAKSAFLANMSHELRTPLNAIIGYSEMLQEEMEDRQLDDLLPDLKKIRGAGKHLLSIIDDILDLSRIEAGKIELKPEPFAVSGLLREVGDTCRPLAARRTNTLEVLAVGELGDMVADHVRVRQVLLNILGNACKFTENGQIVCEVARVTLNGAPWLSFSVRDSGIGMSSEQLGRLFRPFTQADVSSTRKYGGTGLGLAISRQLCQMMGGDIMVESEVGQGSTFTVRLPADPAAASNGLPDAPTPTPRTVPLLGDTRPLALVVDDDRLMRELLVRFLTREGFRTISAASGEEGLRHARIERPALITLDIVMPGLDGWSVLRMLKAEKEFASTPVVMITIVDDPTNGTDLGAADYVTKPIDWRRLSAVLAKHRPPAAAVEAQRY